MTEQDYTNIKVGDVIFNMKDKDAQVVSEVCDGFVRWKGGSSTPKSHLLEWQYVNLMRERDDIDFEKFKRESFKDLLCSFVSTNGNIQNEIGLAMTIDYAASLTDRMVAYLKKDSFVWTLEDENNLVTLIRTLQNCHRQEENSLRAMDIEDAIHYVEVLQKKLTDCGLRHPHALNR